ncbi:MAG: NAD-dependent epimerase/dehydratase family protein [Bacteroidota bacterium]|nr:NAD-dependent epimerase/dehydratase family protein [Bacteroidota bacterium]
MILVTGGTGLVGAHLLFELCLQNEKLIATRRPGSDVQAVRKVFNYYTSEKEADSLFSRILWKEADLLDIPALEKAFVDINIVYHCAALISFDPKDEQLLRKTNIKGTANLVNLSIDRKVEKFCYVSSVAALGSPDKNRKVTEVSKWNPEENHNDYAISKHGAEIEVWRGSQEGLKVYIVNPGIIVGPGFWNSGSGELFSRIDKGLSYHFPKVSGFVSVHDVVKAMLMLTGSDHENEQFVLVAENLSFEQVLKQTAKYLQKPVPNKQLKKWMIATGWFFQKIGGIFGRRQQITRDSINGLFEATYYDSSKIQKHLSFHFQPVDEALEETAKIYLQKKN